MTAFRRPLRRGPLVFLAALLLLASGLFGGLACSKAPHSRVFIIGLDGATFDVLGPWLAKGELPNLKKLMDQGVSGELRSVYPCLSPVAWTSAATGVNPGKHGIYDFQRPDPAMPVHQILYTSQERRATPIWTLLSDAGKSVSICNVPMTWPPDKVSGLMISGFPFPEQTDDITWTSPADLQKSLPDYPLDRMGEALVAGAEGARLAEIVRSRDAVADVFKDWLKNRQDDFTWVVFTATDRVQHFFWAMSDPKHPYYTPQLGQDYGEAIHEFWKGMDLRLGEILAQMPADATIVVISDHGFGPIYRELNTANWFKTTPLNDYVKTHQVPDMYITNGIFRYRLGTNYPMNSNYELFRDMYIKEADAIVDPVTGLKPVEKVLKREELFAGRNLAKAPDLVMIEAKDYYVGPGDPGKEMDPITPLHSTSYSAYHRPNGLFIIKGPGVRTGQLEGASLLDVAPTALYLMGQPVPSEMEGRVLKAVFTPERLQKDPPKYSDGQKILSDQPERVLSPAEREQLNSVPYIK